MNLSFGSGSGTNQNLDSEFPFQFIITLSIILLLAIIFTGLQHETNLKKIEQLNTRLQSVVSENDELKEKLELSESKYAKMGENHQLQIQISNEKYEKMKLEKEEAKDRFESCALNNQNRNVRAVEAFDRFKEEIIRKLMKRDNEIGSLKEKLALSESKNAKNYLKFQLCKNFHVNCENDLKQIEQACLSEIKRANEKLELCESKHAKMAENLTLQIQTSNQKYEKMKLEKEEANAHLQSALLNRNEYFESWRDCANAIEEIEEKTQENYLILQSFQECVSENEEIFKGKEKLELCKMGENLRLEIQNANQKYDEKCTQKTSLSLKGKLAILLILFLLIFKLCKKYFHQRRNSSI